jgi:N-acetylglutamate synthase-like GNAT family acetyltransferase
VGKLIIREARSSDRKAVVAFSAKIWEGHDYLPRAWDQWLEESFGALLVAELDGRTVGTDKVTVLAPGEVWLEGLRVDPLQRSKGIAWALNERAMEIVKKLKPSTVRFSTVFDNQASRHMGEQAGFRFLFPCRRLLAQAKKGNLPREALGGIEDVDDILAFFEKSTNFRQMKGLFAWGWIFKTLDRPFVERVVVEGGALVARSLGKISGLALFLKQRHGPKAALGIIDGDDRTIAALAGQFRIAAQHLGFSELISMVPESSMPLLRAAGFRLEEPTRVVVYQLSGERLKRAFWAGGNITVMGSGE